MLTAVWLCVCVTYGACIPVFVGFDHTAVASHNSAGPRQLGLAGIGMCGLPAAGRQAPSWTMPLLPATHQSTSVYAQLLCFMRLLLGLTSQLTPLLLLRPTSDREEVLLEVDRLLRASTSMDSSSPCTAGRTQAQENSFWLKVTLRATAFLLPAEGVLLGARTVRAVSCTSFNAKGDTSAATAACSALAKGLALLPADWLLVVVSSFSTGPGAGSGMAIGLLIW